MKIRIGIVDDEQPALRWIERLLAEFQEVSVEGVFTDSEELLAGTAAGKFDLVLLDMEMSDMHGLELAKRIYAMRPKIYIAFITAYEQFAQQAYDVEALDYIMKPVTKESLNRALRRFAERQPLRQAITELKLCVRYFGWFTVMTNQGELVKFRNSKSRELLALLAVHKGIPVSKSKIIEALWYGKDSERSQVNLHSTVYQLRKDLELYGFRDIIEQDKGEGGSYRLKLLPEYDELGQFRELCDGYRTFGDIRYAHQAVQLYQAGLWKEHDWEWALPLKRETEAAYQLLLEGIVSYECRLGHYAGALPYLQLLVGLNPYHESIQAKLIAAYLLDQDHLAAKVYFDKIYKLFKDDLDAAPGFSLEQIAADPKAYI